MLFLIGLCILFALCVFATVFLVTRVVRGVYEKRFRRNVNKHLNTLPRKTEQRKFPNIIIKKDERLLLRRNLEMNLKPFRMFRNVLQEPNSF